MWWWIWTALIVGSLGVGFLTWRALWRQGRGVVTTLGESGARLGDALGQSEDRARERLDNLEPVRHTLDRDPIAARWDIEVARAQRRAHRRRPRPQVWARWRTVWN